MKNISRAMAAILNLAMVVAGSPKTTEIRKVDFRNFSFSWYEHRHSIPSTWRWFSSLPKSHIPVANGVHHFNKRGQNEYHRRRVSVSSVTYGDLDGDGIEEAAVDLNYSTGGTANWDYLYVYKLVRDQPTLLAILQSGPRGDGGLIRTAIQDDLLVLDFADPDRRVGDCCSEGYIRVHYRWRDGAFVEEGPRERGDLKLDLR